MNSPTRPEADRHDAGSRNLSYVAESSVVFERYTFYPTDGLCTLHEQCGVVSEECEDCMSGQDTCPACNVGGECEGLNFHLEPDVEEQQCLVEKISVRFPL